MANGRECAKCGYWKFKDDFHSTRTQHGGIYSYCKGCESQRSKQKRDKRNLRKKIAEILSAVLQKRMGDTPFVPGFVRRCTRCKQWVPPSAFGKSKEGADGLNSVCRPCQNKRLWERRETDAVYRDKILFRNRNRTDAQKMKYKENNRKRMAEDASIAIKRNDVHRRWNHKNREGQNKKRRDKYAKNPEPLKRAAYKWRDENKEKAEAVAKRAREKNRDKLNEAKKVDWQRRKANTAHHLSDTLRRSMCRGIKKQRTPLCWKKLVDYTIVDLKKHLEARFLPGMTWENHGKHGWHIDHIIPISAFNFTSHHDLDFKRCWALSNLQPLWAKENLQKNDRLDQPFQPALALQLPQKP